MKPMSSWSESRPTSSSVSLTRKSRRTQSQCQRAYRKIQNLRAEQEAVRQKMAEEFAVLKQNALVSETIFAKELDELKTQLSLQVSLNLRLTTELKAEREALEKITGQDDKQPPKEAEGAEEKQGEEQEPISPALELEPLKEAQVVDETQCEETIIPALALEPQIETQGNVPDRTSPPRSVWKRTRHFLGLRKPESWKRRRED
ncbi:hypothetical protein GBF38_004144 [Nibea albiflora]|uniref:Uncharacterized protein n=1 Tax=Nibea albiflora TaxID=240163 RepID=A0ACB7FBG9_NIBAL|nr:hypothetical protein GBF38_004144 [Nibea albiflora]